MRKKGEVKENTSKANNLEVLSAKVKAIQKKDIEAKKQLQKEQKELKLKNAS